MALVGDIDVHNSVKVTFLFLPKYTTSFAVHFLTGNDCGIKYRI